MSIEIQMTQNANGIWDYTVDENGDISQEESFDSKILYSIYGERRANPSEVPVSQNRRGWIGNEGVDFENGSKVWLYYQARLTRTIMNNLNNAVSDSLQWLVNKGLVADVKSNVRLINGVVAVELTIFRFNSEVETRFYELWNNTGSN